MNTTQTGWEPLLDDLIASLVPVEKISVQAYTLGPGFFVGDEGQWRREPEQRACHDDRGNDHFFY